MRLFLSAIAFGTLFACGAPVKHTVDAGPDTSCGIDCAAQTTFGLIANRCFEYASTNTDKESPPALGVWVRSLFELEGGVKTFPVEYRQGGLIVQTDYFTIKNGELWLVRRIVNNQSVSYRTDAALSGVKWLSDDPASGENFETSTTAFLSKDSSSTATAYRVTIDTPTAAEKKTPSGTYDNAVRLLLSEEPNHGADSRRVFVKDLGFTLITSPFNLSGTGGAPTAKYLQRVRDIGTADAGSESCSLGNP